jgi:hypothetical protein
VKDFSFGLPSQIVLVKCSSPAEAGLIDAVVNCTGCVKFLAGRN